MFMLPPPAPAITLLCTSCMPLVRARVFRGPPSVQHHRQPCSCASRKSVVIVKYPALAPRVLALHDRTAKSSMSFHTTSTRAPSDGLSRDAEDMMLRLLSLQECRAPKKQRTINATHCAYGTRRSSSNRPPSTKTLVNKRWPSVAAQLHTLLETRPQQHTGTMMRREHSNRTDRHNLCMRMQPTARTLLCGAKHDCTMNALRTGHSQHERQGSRPNRHDADNLAGPVERMPSAGTHMCRSC